MNDNWKPGDADVAQIAWTSTGGRHGGNGLALRCSEDYDESHWRTQAFGIIPDGWVTDIRRLVVIDPEDREQVERLAKAMHESDHIAPWHDLHNETRAQIEDAMQAALREFASPPPPKPEEPTGVGAVVEDANGYQWVYSGGPQPSEGRVWYSPNLNGTALYSEIAAVRVLSEGVTP